MIRKFFKDFGKLVAYIKSLKTDKTRNYYIHFNKTKTIYVFIKNIKNNSYIDSYKIKISNKTSKEYIINTLKKKISSYQTSFYKYKFHYFVIENNDKLFIKFSLLFCKIKIKKILTDIKRFLLKIINKSLQYIDILATRANAFLLENPIKKTISAFSITLSFLVFYTITLLFFKNFTIYEINPVVISQIIEILFIFTFAVLSLFWLFILLNFIFFKEWRKYFSLFVISTYIIINIIILRDYILLLNTSNKQFLESSIIKMYFQIQKFPSFALLSVKKENNITTKLVIIRYINNGFVYYNSICDLNISKDINISKKSLNIVQVYNKIKSYILYAYNSKFIINIEGITSNVNTTKFINFYNNQCLNKHKKE